MLTEFWFSLQVAPEDRYAFVIDVSDVAWRHFNAIVGLIKSLSNALPGGKNSLIYFLGNATPVLYSNFLDNVQHYFQSNRGRTCIITPVFEALKFKPDITIVVLGAGRIFDLEDWENDSILKRTRFVFLGQQSITSKLLPELSPNANILLSNLHNPIQKVEIGEKGWIPFYWDNPDYQLENTTLIAKGLPSFAIKVGFLGQRDSQLHAVATLQNGKKRKLVLTSIKPVNRQTRWKNLTPKEIHVFEQCVKQGAFNCPICNTVHPANVVRCKNASSRGFITGTPIYQTIEQANGFVLLRQLDNLVQYSSYSGQGLKLNASEVAVLSGPIAEIYRYDMTTADWQKSGKRMMQYYPLGENTYAIIL